MIDLVIFRVSKKKKKEKVDSDVFNNSVLSTQRLRDHFDQQQLKTSVLYKKV